MDPSYEIPQEDNLENEADAEQEPERRGTADATFAKRIFLLSSIINNFADDSNSFIIASLLSFGAGLLIYKAAIFEVEDQQLVPGVTTFANRLKLMAGVIGIFVSIILLWALIIETILRQPTVVTGDSPLTGATGAFFV